MLDFFILYMNFESLGRIDNSHLSFADQSEVYAKDPKCLKLAELHSDAVDFGKTGYQPEVSAKLFCKEFPDFMEKKDKAIEYES